MRVVAKIAFVRRVFALSPGCARKGDSPKTARDGSNTRSTNRRGFSLVELLVVLGVISLLAGIGIFATRPFQSRSAVNSGALLLQEWLTVARQRALYYQKPCGLRLMPGDEISDNNGSAITTMVTKAVYIQQQDDIVGTGISTSAGSKVLTTTTPLPINLSSTDNAYIDINGGLVYSIASAPNGGTTINLNNPFPYALPQNANVSYRIYRTPAALTGSTDISDAASQEVLRMPRGSAINIGANAKYSTTYPGTGLTPANPPMDVIFGPDGSVTVPSINADKIMFWVTGTAKGADGSVDERQGQPGLVVVVVRTGYIAGYPVDVIAANSPYSQVP